MGGLFTFLAIGMIIYMLFSKNGGMGCCGAHHDDHSGGSPERSPRARVNPMDSGENDVIDLRKEDYQVISISPTDPHLKNR